MEDKKVFEFAFLALGGASRMVITKAFDHKEALEIAMANIKEGEKLVYIQLRPSMDIIAF